MSLKTGHTGVYFSPTNVLIFHSMVEASKFMVTKLQAHWTVKLDVNDSKGTYTVYWGA